ncbi:cytochrome c [Fictibacillus sp. Mic-4]|uniref:cytochrome c550 n=1 Tax=Fictibacillus TaxID=1329200 RepID=UPI00040CE5E7|nr:cytochrome c [Fictibacillus gelatini]
MKRNPLVPFYVIAIIGIVAIISVSGWGIHNKNEAQKAKEKAALNPETIVKKNCTSCHGQNLEGAVGPNLQHIGKELSKDDILNTIKNGKKGAKGQMPAGVIQGDEANIVADWLSKKK